MNAPEKIWINPSTDLQKLSGVMDKDSVQYIQADTFIENLDERMIAKYLYEKKGYPIDLNGHLPSFDETMKDVEKYNAYKEDKFIEKACEFLMKTVWDVTYEDLEGNSTQHYDKMEFIEAFKNYMKGE